MKKILLFSTILFLFAGCNYHIIRYGYDKSKNNTKLCDIIIVKQKTISDSVATKIGEVKLGNTGFTSDCSEEKAMIILRQEACGLNADFVNVYEENVPHSVNDCYKCRADFFVYKNKNNKLFSTNDDVAHQNQNVIIKEVRVKKNSIVAMIASGVLGFVVGAFIFYHQ